MNTSSIHQPQTRRYTTLDGRLCNALDKARERRNLAIRLGEFVYMVKSQRDGHPAHYIEVTEHGLQCDCEAAQYNQPCFHAATVARRLARERRPVTRRSFEYGAGELFAEDGSQETPEMTAVLGPKPRPTLLDPYR